MQCDEDCRTAGFGKTERPVGWEGDGELSRVKLVRHCERGKPAGTDRLHLQALSHSFTLDFVILCKERPEFYLEQAKLVLDRLGLTLNAKKTRILNAREETFDFLGHRFAVQPSKVTGKLKTYYYPSPKAMKSVKKKIREFVRSGQHWDLPVLVKEKINPLLRGWGNYFKTGNSRKHFQSIANYTTWTLCIMLRKKHKKRSKGWKDHPPSWFYDYQGLFKLHSLSVVGDVQKRYGRSVPS